MTVDPSNTLIIHTYRINIDSRHMLLPVNELGVIL